MNEKNDLIDRQLLIELGASLATTGCTVTDCHRGGKIIRGYCGMHYERWRTHGDPTKVLHFTRGTKFCAVEGCDRDHYGRNWCRWHYDRWREHGDPLGGKTWGVAEKFYSDNVVVETDDCIDWPHAVITSNYGRYKSNGRLVYPHREACELANGPRPHGMVARHLCGRSLCFNPRHLRWGTRERNALDVAFHETHGVGPHAVALLIAEGLA